MGVTIEINAFSQDKLARNPTKEHNLKLLSRKTLQKIIFCTHLPTKKLNLVLFNIKSNIIPVQKV